MTIQEAKDKFGDFEYCVFCGSKVKPCDLKDCCEGKGELKGLVCLGKPSHHSEHRWKIKKLKEEGHIVKTGLLKGMANEPKDYVWN